MVRRTRTFIQDNYAKTDPVNGRKFLTFEDGTRSYFPTRVPLTLKFKINDKDAGDQYARLYAFPVVDAINQMHLPRYGLGNYVAAKPHKPPTQNEAKQLDDLSRAGKRLMGFCRTNLFKRLESSGEAFQQSLERHVLRNYIFLHAIENDLPLPLGTLTLSSKSSSAASPIRRAPPEVQTPVRRRTMAGRMNRACRARSGRMAHGQYPKATLRIPAALSSGLALTHRSSSRR